MLTIKIPEDKNKANPEIKSATLKKDIKKGNLLKFAIFKNIKDIMDMKAGGNEIVI